MIAGAKKHQSIEALLAKYPGEQDPAAIIRRLSREKIAELGPQWDGPPFCPRALASHFGIRCRAVDHDIGGEGRLLTIGGKPWIEFRRGQTPERERFTIFHEFAHTFFPDCWEYVRHIQAGRELTPEEKAFENLCDVGAAELMFPQPHLLNDLAGSHDTGFHTVHRLRVRYGASIEPTVRRYVEVAHARPCAALFLVDQKGKHEGEGPLWVKYYTKHTGFGHFVAPGMMPPADSVVLRCYGDGAEATCEQIESWTVRGKTTRWKVQASRIPDVPEAPSYPKVAALLWTP